MEKYREIQVNKRGTLVTAASLLFLVVYTTGGYDAWDVLVPVIATIFGVSFQRFPSIGGPFQYPTKHQPAASGGHAVHSPYNGLRCCV